MPNLEALIRNVYEPAGVALSKLVIPEAESADYGACRFGLGGHNIVFRVAKTTPTKIGQFVTLWKRLCPGNSIAPLDANDSVDFVIVHTSSSEHQGQFIFDKHILVKKGIFSSSGSAGKRAIRVYPPWSQPVAKDAVRTQQWQLHYFLDIADDGTADLMHTKRLFANLTGNSEIRLFTREDDMRTSLKLRAG